jgi:hypothetical protein
MTYDVRLAAECLELIFNRSTLLGIFLSSAPDQDMIRSVNTTSETSRKFTDQALLQRLRIDG